MGKWIKKVLETPIGTKGKVIDALGGTKDERANAPSIRAVKNDMFNLIYPVGSIYMSVNSTDPGTLFGGTWEQIEDRFLLAAGSTYAAGTTGGTKTHSHNLDQQYSTAFAKFNAIGSTMWYSRYTKMPNAYSTSAKIVGSSYQDTTVSHSDAIGLGGSTQVVSNMPPYLTVYVWKRTA